LATECTAGGSRQRLPKEVFDMTRPARIRTLPGGSSPAPKAKSLAQEQSDFTSEGAPAPGEAATNVLGTAEQSAQGESSVFERALAQHVPAAAGKKPARRLPLGRT
jgi:hypothetical protein